MRMPIARRIVPAARPVCSVSSMIDGSCGPISPVSMPRRSWLATWTYGCSIEAASMVILTS